MSNISEQPVHAFHPLERLGGFVIRYSLVVILVWIGTLKFTAYEAQGIEPLMTNSPLMSWSFQYLELRDISRVIGVIEIVLGLLIMLGGAAPRLSALGSIVAVGMFLTTLSFLFTTPGIWQPEYGFPYLSPLPGQFLIKDILLLGAAIWTAGDSLRRQYVVTQTVTAAR